MKNNQKFSVTIWPNKQKEKNGRIPLYIKVSVDSKKVVISTTHFIELSHWDKKQNKLKFNAPDCRQLNAFIDRTRNLIQLAKNKTGDIICTIDGNEELKIAIEAKFDKSIKFGDIASKDVFIRKSDTAWSQLIEADANRGSKISIIVFDISLVDGSILRIFDTVGFIPGVGFVAIIDSQKGDYSNLAIAYTLARDIALNARQMDLDKDVLAMIITRIIKDINEVTKIRSLVHMNIENNKAILGQLEKSILLMEFNQEYLMKFLKDGTLTKKDLLDFYMGEDVKERYKMIEKEINGI